MPTITVGARTNHHQHGHPPQHYSSKPRRARPGNMLVGFFLLTGLFIGCALLASSLTISTATSSLAGSGLLSVAAISISASMLATGAAVLTYLAAGAISTVYAGFQTYNSSNPWTEALKDVVYFNRYLDEERSLKSIFTAITAVSVSPFLLIGGLGGLAFKASITAYRDWNKASLPTSDLSISNSYDSSLRKLSASPGKGNSIENKYNPTNEYTPLLTSTPNSSPFSSTHGDDESSDENTPGACYFNS